MNNSRDDGIKFVSPGLAGVRKYLPALAVALVAGVVGFAGLRASQAATVNISQEAEAGSLTGNYTPGEVAGASGGASVRFGSSQAAGSWFKPAKNTTWQWQIDGGSIVNENVGVQMYDIDLQDAIPAATPVTVTWPAANNFQATATWPQGVNAGVVGRLHAKGAKVICYTDTGAFENYRPDASLFPGKWGSGNTTRVNDANQALSYNGPPQWSSVDVIGGGSEAANGSTFAGEYWLDQRQSAWQYWEPIMISRLKLAKSIGCDGLEGDQNNAYGNDSSFGVTEADSLKLYQEMFRQHHAIGLGAIAKNGLELVQQMLAGVNGETAGQSKPDGFLNEECNNFSECSPGLTAAASDGYWVGQVEYTENGSTTSFCAADNQAGFMGLLKHLNLGTYAYQCWNGQTVQ